MNVELHRTTVSKRTDSARPWQRLGWAGIGLGITLVVVALIPVLPLIGSRSVASLTHSTPFSKGVKGSQVAATAVSPGQALQSIDPGPKRLTIPMINLSASVVPIDLQPDGSLAAPENFSLVGWYTGGTTPGQPGPSVIVGHVDSHLGPAVFFRLHELVPGQSILIETVNDTFLTFIVERIEQHHKGRFPTAEVYGSTNQRALRLITCGGEFDRAAGSYRDNIVVFASLATT